MSFSTKPDLETPNDPASKPYALAPTLQTTACLDALEANLREPLRALENAADAVAVIRSPEQQGQIRGSIRHAALMIERATDAAMDLIRCQHGVLQPELTTFTLRSLLHESAITARSSPTPTARVIQVQAPADEVVIRADRRRIVRVVAGLVSAADAWAEEGSPITLSATWLEPEPEVAQLEVLVRVPLEPAPHITRPLLSFLEPSVAAVADDIEVQAAVALARHFGATIRLSEVPPGFSLVLQCRLIATRAGAHSSVNAHAARCAPILMLDTPARSLRPLEGALSQAGYEPLRAQHRDEALGFLFGRSPALILLAADRSSDQGLQFARHVRANVQSARLPILLVAYDLTVAELNGARRSVDAVLVAPVSTKEIVRYVSGSLAPDRRSDRRECEIY